MSPEKATGFTEKVLMVLDGSIEDDEFSGLDRLIATDPKAAQRYVDMLLIHLALSRPVGVQGDEPQDAPASVELDPLLGELFSGSHLPIPPKGHRASRRGPSRRVLAR